jgi:hypothetical protein
MLFIVLLHPVLYEGVTMRYKIPLFPYCHTHISSMMKTNCLENIKISYHIDFCAVEGESLIFYYEIKLHKNKICSIFNKLSMYHISS